MNKSINNSIEINCPASEIFAALLSAREWEQWFVTECEVGAREGDPIRFSWKNWGTTNDNIVDGGTILKIDEPKEFSFSWAPGSTQTVVTFKLRGFPGSEDRTIVHLTDVGYDEEESVMIDCAIGWGESLLMLKHYLEHGIKHSN